MSKGAVPPGEAPDLINDYSTPNELAASVQLATLITGSKQTAQGWLPRGLRKAAKSISDTARKAAAHPTREDLRKQLQTSLDASRFLRERLSDTVFLKVLSEAAGDDLHGDHQAFNGLGSLVGRLEKALSAIPTGQNRHAYAPGTNSPEAACALSLAVAWRLARGELPPHTSLQAQEACSRLWALGGCPPLGKSDDSLTGWRTHLQRGKKELAKEGGRPEAERLFNPPTR